LHIGTRLPEYDFTRQGFPTTLDSSTYIPFENYSHSLKARGIKYSILFENAADATFLPVPLEIAKKLATTLERSRDITIDLEVDIVGIKIGNREFGRGALITKIRSLSITQKEKTIFGKTLSSHDVGKMIL
jgi:hypothetical protein